MKITVRSEEVNLCIPFPTAIIFNDLTAGIAPRFLSEHGLNVTPQQARKFMRAIRKFKRRHRDWVLCEVQSADGDYVEVKL